MTAPDIDIDPYECGDCGAAKEVTTREGVDEINGPGDERWYCPVCEPEVADA